MRTPVALMALGLLFSTAAAAPRDASGPSTAMLDPPTTGLIVKPLPHPGGPTPMPQVEPGWSNAGGNPMRDGLSLVTGPTFLDPLWTRIDHSNSGWQPLIEGDRVFDVRQGGGFPSPSDSPVVALSLDTGEQLWRGDDQFSIELASRVFNAAGYFSPGDATIDVVVCPP